MASLDLTDSIFPGQKSTGTRSPALCPHRAHDPCELLIDRARARFFYTDLNLPSELPARPPM